MVGPPSSAALLVLERVPHTLLVGLDGREVVVGEISSNK